MIAAPAMHVAAQVQACPSALIQPEHRGMGWWELFGDRNALLAGLDRPKFATL